MFSRIEFKTEGEYDDSYDYSMSSSQFDDQGLNQLLDLLDYSVSRSPFKQFSHYVLL